MQTQVIPFQRGAGRATAVVVDEVAADALPVVVDSLAALFADIVNAGVSLGFVPPLSREQSGAYWRLQDAALRRGRSLIHLNTRQGEAAEGFYKRLHYREAGTIPGWTLGPAGERYAHMTLFRDLRS